MSYEFKKWVEDPDFLPELLARTLSEDIPWVHHRKACLDEHIIIADLDRYVIQARFRGGIDHVQLEIRNKVGQDHSNHYKELLSPEMEEAIMADFATFFRTLCPVSQVSQADIMSGCDAYGDTPKEEECF